MTQTLARTLEDLAGGVLDAAAGAPIAIRQIEAELPMEFDLKRRDGELTLAMRPPEVTQARELSVPLGRFAFTLAMARGDDDG
jgi:hypothetical protein